MMIPCIAYSSCALLTPNNNQGNLCKDKNRNHSAPPDSCSSTGAARTPPLPPPPPSRPTTLTPHTPTQARAPNVTTSTSQLPADPTTQGEPKTLGDNSWRKEKAVEVKAEDQRYPADLDPWTRQWHADPFVTIGDPWTNDKAAERSLLKQREPEDPEFQSAS